MAAAMNLNVQCRLATHARWLLRVAAVLARIGLPIPHQWVIAVTNRSWSMRIGDGPWQPYRGAFK
jgi:hypothetical protein